MEHCDTKLLAAEQPKAESLNTDKHPQNICNMLSWISQRLLPIQIAQHIRTIYVSGPKKLLKI